MRPDAQTMELFSAYCLRGGLCGNVVQELMPFCCGCLLCGMMLRLAVSSHLLTYVRTLGVPGMARVLQVVAAEHLHFAAIPCCRPLGCIHYAN
jgi:hypothetical protein